MRRPIGLPTSYRVDWLQGFRGFMTIDTDVLIELHRRNADDTAGPAGAMAERALVYHRLYAHSGGNHCFALVAAHGALWGHGYFRLVRRLARLAGLSELVLHPSRRTVVRRTDALIAGLMEINRGVCAETLFIYSITADPRLRARCEALVAPALLERMLSCHAARAAGRKLSPFEQAALYDSFFAWDQEYVVTQRLAEVYGAFDCRVVDWLAIRPTIRFAYFRHIETLIFRNFLDVDERIEKGRIAYDRAVRAGWDRVEALLTGHPDLSKLAGAMHSSLHSGLLLVPSEV